MVFNNEKIEELLEMDMSYEELVKELTNLGYKVNEVVEFTAMKKISYYKYDLSHIHITTKDRTITKVYYKYLEEFEQIAWYHPSIRNERGTLDMEASNLKSKLVMGYENELYLFDGRITNKEPIDTGLWGGYKYGISGASQCSVDATFKNRMVYATNLEYHLSAKLYDGKSFMDYLKDDSFINMFQAEYRGSLKRARALKSSHNKITLNGKGTRVRIVSGACTFDLSLGLAKDLFSSQNVGYMETLDLTEFEYNSGKLLTMRDKKNNTEDFQFFIKTVLDNYNIRKDKRVKELCKKIENGEIKFDVDGKMQKVLQEIAFREFNITG